MKQPVDLFSSINHEIPGKLSVYIPSDTTQLPAGTPIPLFPYNKIGKTKDNIKKYKIVHQKALIEHCKLYSRDITAIEDGEWIELELENSGFEVNLDLQKYVREQNWTFRNIPTYLDSIGPDNSLTVEISHPELPHGNTYVIHLQLPSIVKIISDSGGLGKLPGTYCFSVTNETTDNYLNNSRKFYPVFPLKETEKINGPKYVGNQVSHKGFTTRVIPGKIYYSYRDNDYWIYLGSVAVDYGVMTGDDDNCLESLISNQMTCTGGDYKDGMHCLISITRRSKDKPVDVFLTLSGTDKDYNKFSRDWIRSEQYGLTGKTDLELLDSYFNYVISSQSGIDPKINSCDMRQNFSFEKTSRKNLRKFKLVDLYPDPIVTVTRPLDVILKELSVSWINRLIPDPTRFDPARFPYLYILSGLFSMVDLKEKSMYETYKEVLIRRSGLVGAKCWNLSLKSLGVNADDQYFQKTRPGEEQIRQYFSDPKMYNMYCSYSYPGLYGIGNCSFKKLDESGTEYLVYILNFIGPKTLSQIFDDYYEPDTKIISKKYIDEIYIPVYDEIEKNLKKP